MTTAGHDGEACEGEEGVGLAPGLEVGQYSNWTALDEVTAELTHGGSASSNKTAEAWYDFETEFNAATKRLGEINTKFAEQIKVMKDALDADGIWTAIRDAGLELPDRPHPSDLDGRLVNVFLKCEASRDGMVRGRRNAMLDDSDVHWHRQIKACVGGVAATVTGDPAVFVSVSAAHQGPDGGGPVAAIVDLGG